MDVLGEVMALLRIKGQIYGRLEFIGPFNVRFPHEAGHCLIVTRGSCFLSVEGGKPIPLVSGDFVIMPAAKSYSLKSSAELEKPVDISPLQAEEYVQTRRLNIGKGKGLPVSLISGCFTFASPGSRLLTEHLPSFIHLPGNAAHAPAGLQTVLQMIAYEIGQDLPGSTTAIDRLSEVLFIYALRSPECSERKSPSWLTALADPQVAKSLSQMHSQPEKAWTVEELARSVGMSRSSFAAKFKSAVGKTPLDHLTQWRMFKAAALMSDPKAMKVEDIAAAVGYESERAFRKAFKKFLGTSPRDYKQNLKE